MAHLASILVPSNDVPIFINSLAAVTASAVQVIGKNRIFAINGQQDTTITFGNSKGGAMAAPTGASFRIPAGQTLTFDTGNAFDQIQMFNVAGAATDSIWIGFFSVL